MSLLNTICFYVFGVVCLSPWNFFITPQSYWNAKFSDKNSTNGTLNEYQQFWDSSLSVAICGVQFTFCCIGTVLINFFSRKVRFISCLLSLITLFLICAIMAPVDTSDYNQAFFIVSLFIAVMMTILSSTLNITCSVEATEFNRVAVFLSGQSMAGIIAAIANIMTISFSNDVYVEALSFFVAASVIILVGFGSYIAIYGLCDSTGPKISEYDDLDDCSQASDPNENQPLLRENSTAQIAADSYWQIFLQLKTEACCLVATFMLTIAVFPTLVSMYEPSDDLLPKKYFLPVFCFLNFNLFDYIGRELAGRISSLQNKNVLIGSTAFRLIIVALIAMTNCQPRHTPVYFHQDWVYIGLITIFALGNGLNASISFIIGCDSVSESSAPRAAAFLTICLTAGLTLGACFSFLVILVV